MNLFDKLRQLSTQPTAPLFPRDMSAEHVRERAKGFGLYGEARVVDEHVRKVAPWVADCAARWFGWWGVGGR